MIAQCRCFAVSTYNTQRWVFCLPTYFWSIASINWPMTKGTLCIRLISSCARTSSRLRLLLCSEDLSPLKRSNSETYLCSSLIYSSCKFRYLRCFVSIWESKHKGERHAPGVSVAFSALNTHQHRRCRDPRCQY